MIAYYDEYPWVRCTCGWLLNGEEKPCPGCGRELRTHEVQYLDRFNPNGQTKGYTGQFYRPVPYEDRNRRL